MNKDRSSQAQEQAEHVLCGGRHGKILFDWKEFILPSVFGSFLAMQKEQYIPNLSLS